jgi:glycosyltransferase involved in cell wall biosynthesis
LAIAEGVSDRIEWEAFVPQPEISRRLRSTDIGIVPTRGVEGRDASAPLKLFEYMASGLAVVASDLPSIRAVIQHGHNGLLFRDGDPDSLAAAVARLIEYPEERARLATHASQDVQRFSWQERGRRILAFLENLSTF